MGDRPDQSRTKFARPAGHAPRARRPRWGFAPGMPVARAIFFWRAPRDARASGRFSPARLAPLCPYSRRECPSGRVSPLGRCLDTPGPKTRRPCAFKRASGFPRPCAHVRARPKARAYPRGRKKPLDTSVHHPLRGVPWRSAGTPRVPESRGAPTAHGAPMGVHVVYQCGFKKK